MSLQKRAFEAGGQVSKVPARDREGTSIELIRAMLDELAKIDQGRADQVEALLAIDEVDQSEDAASKRVPLNQQARQPSWEAAKVETEGATISEEEDAEKPGGRSRKISDKVVAFHGVLHTRRNAKGSAAEPQQTEANHIGEESTPLKTAKSRSKADQGKRFRTHYPSRFGKQTSRHRETDSTESETQQRIGLIEDDRCHTSQQQRSQSQQLEPQQQDQQHTSQNQVSELPLSHSAEINTMHHQQLMLSDVSDMKSSATNSNLLYSAGPPNEQPLQQRVRRHSAGTILQPQPLSPGAQQPRFPKRELLDIEALLAQAKRIGAGAQETSLEGEETVSEEEEHCIPPLPRSNESGRFSWDDQNTWSTAWAVSPGAQEEQQGDEEDEGILQADFILPCVTWRPPATGSSMQRAHDQAALHPPGAGQRQPKFSLIRPGHCPRLERGAPSPAASRTPRRYQATHASAEKWRYARRPMSAKSAGRDSWGWGSPRMSDTCYEPGKLNMEVSPAFAAFVERQEVAQAARTSRLRMLRKRRSRQYLRDSRTAKWMQATARGKSLREAQGSSRTVAPPSPPPTPQPFNQDSSIDPGLASSSAAGEIVQSSHQSLGVMVPIDSFLSRLAQQEEKRREQTEGQERELAAAEAQARNRQFLNRRSRSLLRRRRRLMKDALTCFPEEANVQPPLSILERHPQHSIPNSACQDLRTERHSVLAEEGIHARLYHSPKGFKKERILLQAMREKQRAHASDGELERAGLSNRVRRKRGRKGRQACSEGEGGLETNIQDVSEGQKTEECAQAEEDLDVIAQRRRRLPRTLSPEAKSAIFNESLRTHWSAHSQAEHEQTPGHLDEGQARATSPSKYTLTRRKVIRQIRQLLCDSNQAGKIHPPVFAHGVGLHTTLSEHETRSLLEHFHILKPSVADMKDDRLWSRTWSLLLKITMETDIVKEKPMAVEVGREQVSLEAAVMLILQVKTLDISSMTRPRGSRAGPTCEPSHLALLKDLQDSHLLNRLALKAQRPEAAPRERDEGFRVQLSRQSQKIVQKLKQINQAELRKLGLRSDAVYHRLSEAILRVAEGDAEDPANTIPCPPPTSADIQSSPAVWAYLAKLKQIESEQKRRQAIRDELAEVYPRPYLNPHSREIIAKQRRDQNQQLQEEESSQAKGSHFDRLNEHWARIQEDRRVKAQTARKEREQIELQQCSFQPHVPDQPPVPPPSLVSLTAYERQKDRVQRGQRRRAERAEIQAKTELRAYLTQTKPFADIDTRLVSTATNAGPRSPPCSRPRRHEYLSCDNCALESQITSIDTAGPAGDQMHNNASLGICRLQEAGRVTRKDQPAIHKVQEDTRQPAEPMGSYTTAEQQVSSTAKGPLPDQADQVLQGTGTIGRLAKPVLFVELVLSCEGVTEKIVVYEDQTAQEVVGSARKRHQLSESATKTLEDVLTRQLAQLRQPA